MGTTIWFGLHSDRARAAEVASKSFVLGMAAVGLLTFGAALVYAGSGALSLHAYSHHARTQGPNALATLGGLMMLAGLLYRLGAAPFHMAAPDAVEGAPLPAAVFFVTGTRTALTIVVARLCLHLFFYDPLTAESSGVAAVLLLVAGASFLIGSLGAIRQDSVKRMLGYLSVCQLGWVFAALAAWSQHVPGAPLAFAAAVLAGPPALAAALLVTPFVPRITESRSFIGDWVGFAQRRPTLGVCMGLALMSLSGLPLTMGFVAVFATLEACFASRWLLPAAASAIVSLPIGLYAALRLIVTMYFREPPAAPAGEPEERAVWLPMGVGLAVCISAVCVWGVISRPYLHWAELLVESVSK